MADKFKEFKDQQTAHVAYREAYYDAQKRDAASVEGLMAPDGPKPADYDPAALLRELDARRPAVKTTPPAGKGGKIET